MLPETPTFSAEAAVPLEQIYMIANDLAEKVSKNPGEPNVGTYTINGRTIKFLIRPAEDYEDQRGMSGYYEPSTKGITVIYTDDRVANWGDDFIDILGHEIQHALRHEIMKSFNSEIYALVNEFVDNVQSGMSRQDAFQLALEDTPDDIKNDIVKWYYEALMELPLNEIHAIYLAHHKASSEEQEANFAPLIQYVVHELRQWGIRDESSELFENSIKKFIKRTAVESINLELDDKTVSDIFEYVRSVL